MTSSRDVAPLLAERDPEARRRGVQRLHEIDGPDAVALLVQGLGDEDWRVRKEAVTVASAVEPRSLVLQRLAGALGDRNNVGLRNAVVQALVLIGTDAVPVAVDALGRLDADGRKLAVEVLAGVPDLAGIHALAHALSDEDVNVRAAAAEALGSAGLAGEPAQKLAVFALTTALSDDEPLQRLAALRSLTELEAELPWNVLEPLTRQPLLRRHAIAAAARTHEAAAVAGLARATGDTSLAVARDALVALVECLESPTDFKALAQIARHELLASPLAETRIRTLATATDDTRVRGAALVALGLLRSASDVPELVRGLSDEDVSERAELGLRWFGQDAVPPLLAEGTRSSPPVLAAAISLVPQLAEHPDRTTLEALRDALLADAPEVRAAAIQAIALAGGADDMDFVAPHAVSSDPRIAMAACAALTALASRHVAKSRAMAQKVTADSPLAIVGCLLRGANASRGAADARADAEDATGSDVRFLRSALDHDDVRVRRAAVDALAAMGGEMASEVVARALADEEHDVVLAAVRALGRMGKSDPLAALLDAGHDTSVRAAALRALGEVNPAQAFDAAASLLRSEDPMLASSAVETIGLSRGGHRDEALFVALGHADPGVVKSALVELSHDVSPTILARIGVCLDSPSYEVRRFAAELLARENDAAAHALIRTRLDREADPVVREALMLALAPRPRDDP